MAQRLPLVINAGQIEQLQSGDYLANNIDLPIVTNGESSTALIAGMAVYETSTANTAKRAQANASGTINPTGLMQSTSTPTGQTGSVQTEGVITLTTGEWDAVVTGESGGLTPGGAYFLDPATPGNLTLTAPTTAGQYVQKLGTALSSTSFKISIEPSILL